MAEKPTIDVSTGILKCAVKQHRGKTVYDWVLLPCGCVMYDADPTPEPVGVYEPCDRECENYMHAVTYAKKIGKPVILKDDLSH